MSVPLDLKIKHLSQLPYTISFVIRKLQQIDNLNELPKEKRPPEDILWEGTSEDLEDWLERVLGNNKTKQDVGFVINATDIEG